MSRRTASLLSLSMAIHVVACARDADKAPPASTTIPVATTTAQAASAAVPTADPACHGCTPSQYKGNDGCDRSPSHPDAIHPRGMGAPTAVPADAIPCPRSCCPDLPPLSCDGCAATKREGCRRDGEWCNSDCCR